MTRCVLLTACGTSDTTEPDEPDESGESGESDDAGHCNAELRSRGTTYAFHPDVITAAARPSGSTRIEPDEVIGCDSEVVNRGAGAHRRCPG